MARDASHASMHDKFQEQRLRHGAQRLQGCLGETKWRLGRAMEKMSATRVVTLEKEAWAVDTAERELAAASKRQQAAERVFWSEARCGGQLPGFS